MTPVLLRIHHSCQWYLQNYHLWLSFSLPLELNHRWGLSLSNSCQNILQYSLQRLIYQLWYQKARKEFVSITTNRLNQTTRGTETRVFTTLALWKRSASFRYPQQRRWTLTTRNWRYHKLGWSIPIRLKKQTSNFFFLIIKCFYNLFMLY